MRSLTVPLILIAGLSITGCKTATKGTACGTACGTVCGASAAPEAGHANVTCCTPAPQTSCTATVPCTTQTAASPLPVAQTSRSIAKPESPFERGNRLPAQPPQAETANPFETPAVEIQRAAAELQTPAYAHGENYGWLVGVLQRVHSPGREWKIRYSPLSEHDQWGGSMVLAPDARLDDWQDGDVVYLEGEILAARPSLYLAGPLYRFHLIRKANSTDLIQQVANQK